MLPSSPSGAGEAQDQVYKKIKGDSSYKLRRRRIKVNGGGDK